MSYALCDDRKALMWFANQRAIEYHPALVCAHRPDHITHLVLDLDPPDADGFVMAVRAARAVRQTLADVGLHGAVKTSGAKGLHVFVPIDNEASMEDSAAAARAIAVRAEQLAPDIATTAFVIQEGHAVPVARVQATHDGKRRARHRRRDRQPSGGAT